MENIFGNVTQFYFCIGWLPNDLVLTVNPANKKYQTKFTVRTWNIENKITSVLCMAEGAIAKQIYEQYRKLEIIIIFGQMYHIYNPVERLTSNKVKVLSFAIPSTFKNSMKEPVISKEAEDTIRYVEKKAYEYYMQNKAKPSDEEIKKWTDIYMKRRN